jgi:predicted amidohydrolase
MSTTKIATCAFPGTYDVDKSVELHLSYIEEAKAAGASLVVFPETSLQGYPPNGTLMGTEHTLRATQATAETVPDGANVAKLIAAAKEQEIYVIFGLTEAVEQPGVLYNTMVLAGPEGYVGKYRKVHVGITEQVFWGRGDQWPVFDTAIGKIGMLICYDKMWPESTRELTLGGAEILIMSTAWCNMAGHGEGDDNLWVRQYKLYDQVRAAENARWFISSNLVGELGGLDFFGLSQIIDPFGDVVATTGTDKVGLVFADIDINSGLAEASAVNQGAFLIRDRRPETYKILTGQASVVVDG